MTALSVPMSVVKKCDGVEQNSGQSYVSSDISTFVHWCIFAS